MKNNQSTSSGVGLGLVIAVVMYWTTNHSVVWCIIHGICSWGYVLYRAAGYGEPHP